MRSEEVEENIVFLKELLELNERMFEEVGSGLFHKNISKAIDTVLNYISESEKENEFDLTSVYMSGFYDGEKKYKDKIRDKIKEIEERPLNKDFIVVSAQIDASLISCLKELLEN